MSLDDEVIMWAEQQVTTLLPHEVRVPAYGTREWLQLPAGDPRKAAALITAAEMWRRYGDEQALLDWFRDACRARPSVADRRTRAELDAAATPRPPHRLRATPGWPPIAVPGQSGRYLVARENAA
ncbi:DUF2742 domain-containing protein [Streptomyces sp. KLOTTS4A1]|uniref:DUF2742 domain-containing protein n=1 Tax=Streptomyces sp. KLOTTS4A1 TaxID=3390996 RepID=UPI0039F4EC62